MSSSGLHLPTEMENQKTIILNDSISNWKNRNSYCEKGEIIVAWYLLVETKIVYFINLRRQIEFMVGNWYLANSFGTIYIQKN